MSMNIHEDIIPKDILKDILSCGCNILSNRQMGKTNLAKVLIAEMHRSLRDIDSGFLFKIFDTAQVWRWSFLNSFAMQEINDETSEVVGNLDVVFDIEFKDSERIMEFMGNQVLQDYDLNRMKKKASSGHLNEWNIYVLEEAQNSLGSYSLNRTSGRIWLKMISESANFNLAFIFIGQRPADISTKAIERMQTYFIGRTTGDRNINKLKGIIGKDAGEEQMGEPLIDLAKRLERGEFIFWNGAHAKRFRCPKFEDLYPDQTPREIVQKTKRWINIF